MAALQDEPKIADLKLTAVLYALSDETRLHIVQSLAESDEIACGYFDIDMPKSSLSHHFRVLRAAGVIATRKEGTALLNRLRRADLEERFPGLLDSVLASMNRKTKSKTFNRTSRRFLRLSPACCHKRLGRYEDSISDKEWINNRRGRAA